MFFFHNTCWLELDETLLLEFRVWKNIDLMFIDWMFLQLLYFFYHLHARLFLSNHSNLIIIIGTSIEPTNHDMIKIKYKFI